MKARARALALPELPAPFPAPFRALLHTLLARPGRIGGARDERQRARAALLSQSGTFTGHRPYVRGDDLRRLDWAAYARSGELFVKQLEEEDRRAVTVLLDLSPRLLAGTPPRRLIALRLAALIAALALQHLDGVCVAAPGAGAVSLATFAGPAAMAALLQHLAALPVAVASPQQSIDLVLQRGVPGRVHWISDFARPKDAEQPLQALRRRGARVTGWLPALPSDRDAPRTGYLRLCDPATGEELEVPIDAALAAELERQLALLARQQERLFTQAGAPLVRWPVPAATDFTAASWQAVVAWCAR
ncbi:MAG: DUF58 domain-containing protein [Planctomycetes bacterium]|nr:DUF58 domain-containing protein [Planctomycetota bacterium]